MIVTLSDIIRKYEEDEDFAFAVNVAYDAFSYKLGSEVLEALRPVALKSADKEDELYPPEERFNHAVAKVSRAQKKRKVIIAVGNEGDLLAKFVLAMADDVSSTKEKAEAYLREEGIDPNDAWAKAKPEIDKLIELHKNKHNETKGI